MIQIPGIILCAGNLTQDILVWPVNDVVFNTTTWVDDIITSFGGNGANTSFAIAKMGGNVRLTGLLGDDAAGNTVLDQLREGGVDVRVGRCGLPTPMTVVIVRTDAARSFLHRPGASREAFAVPMEFTHDIAAGCSHFHLGNPFSMPNMRNQAAAILERALAAGLTTSLDTGWDALGQWMDVIGPCLPHLDILFVNEDEAEKLSGETDPRAAAEFFQKLGAGAVVVKLGARGCALFDEGTELFVPGFAVKAVDTTGAGDCFAGAFLAGLQHGLTSEESAKLANAVGALSVQKSGATTGLLDYNATTEWMRQQN